MEHKSDKNQTALFSIGMLALLLAQFLSALADNALLVIAVAMIKAQGGQSQVVALLQIAFLVPFILLAPFAGALADGFAKGRVMLVANFLKLAGALMMTLGMNPFIAYHLVGIGATIYSPAKYGILSQMFSSSYLVRANGMLESSTIAAILLGVLSGGWLADYSLQGAFVAVLVSYGLALLATVLIPRLPVEIPFTTYRPSLFIKNFLRACKTLLADKDARFSLLGTGIFWGSGTALRLLLFAWVPVALALYDNQTPANLMGMLSIGIVFGAIAAALCVTLKTVNRALIGGVLIGPSILLLAPVTNLYGAAFLMIIIGFFSGLFVVPLNALLQERGHQSVGAGSALAVQNLIENLAMILFAGAYALASFFAQPILIVAIGFGIVLFLLLASLAIIRLYN